MLVSTSKIQYVARQKYASFHQQTKEKLLYEERKISKTRNNKFNIITS